MFIQGCVTTARCGEIFNNDLTANLPRNPPVKKTVNRLRFDRIMAEFEASLFWPTP